MYSEGAHFRFGSTWRGTILVCWLRIVALINLQQSLLLWPGKKSNPNSTWVQVITIIIILSMSWVAWALSFLKRLIYWWVRRFKVAKTWNTHLVLISNICGLIQEWATLRSRWTRWPPFSTTWSSKDPYKPESSASTLTGIRRLRLVVLI